MKHFFSLCLTMALCGSIFSCNDDDSSTLPILIDNIPFKQIYAQSDEYAAFCDLAIVQGKYYAVFRVAPNHIPIRPNENGGIQILSSDDGMEWQKELRLTHELYDLRDPCFCLKEDGNLLLYYGFYNPVDNDLKYRTGYTEFAFETDGKLKEIKKGNVEIGDQSNLWLWKTYRHDGKYWGVLYYGRGINPTFVKSVDGYNFDVISEIEADGNETSLTFDRGGVYAFIRNYEREGCFVCYAEAPYREWKVVQQDVELASPESFMIGDDIFVAGRTVYGMSLYRLNRTTFKLEPAYNYFALGSYSDSGYPGIVVKDNYVWTVFYGSTPEVTMPRIFISKLHTSVIRNGAYTE